MNRIKDVLLCFVPVIIVALSDSTFKLLSTDQLFTGRKKVTSFETEFTSQGSQTTVLNTWDFLETPSPLATRIRSQEVLYINNNKER